MVEIRNLSFAYARKRLFTNLDLLLEPGNIYGLLGKNGAGKTTLLKIICGLRFPQRGECRVLGHLSSLRPAALLEDIFLLPEELYIPPLTPQLYTSLYGPFYRRFDHSVLKSCLKEFELEPAANLSELSFGQKKKFLIAFGLATGSRLLLLDEPTNGLDIPSKSQFRRLMARAGAEGRVVLISTHQVRDMEQLIDPIIILDDGQVIFQQSMAEIGRRLAMTLEPEPPAAGTAVYSDKTLGGFVTVRENRSGEDSRMDIEVLFNAVTGNREQIQELFAGQPSGSGRREV